MVKTRIVLCLAVLAFSVTALAATKEGTVTINGGKQTVVMNGQRVFHPAAHRSAKLKTIYSNLGTGTNGYYCCEGWTISGSTGDVGGEYWIAMPFTPKKNSHVKQLDLGIGYVAGTNELVVTLLSDTGGLPGKTLHKWHYKNMPTFGDCCTLDTIKYSKGIAVKKGKQYWISATTDSTDPDLWGAWNFTYNFVTGPFAAQAGGGGWQADNSDLGAYDVLGSTP